MSVWVWIAIGAGSLIAFSLLVGFVTARILGSVGREVSCILEGEAETWATASRMHATPDREGIAAEEVVSRPQTVRVGEEEFVASGYLDRAGQSPRAAPPEASSGVSAARAGGRRRLRRSPPGRRSNPRPLRR